MDVLNDLDLHGNQILNAYLQGTAKRVSSQFIARTTDMNGSVTRQVSYDGDQPVQFTFGPLDLGAIIRVQMDTGVDLPAVQGVVTIPTIAGAQGIQGVRGPQGVQGLKGRLDEAFYDNQYPSLITVGGIKEGTTFDQVPYDQLLTMMLYPYTKPAISVSSAVRTGAIEKGEIFLDTAITMDVVRKSNDITKIKLYGSSDVVFQTDTNTQTGQLVHRVPILNDTITFYATAEDTEGGLTKSNELVYNFVYPAYYGIAEDIPTGESVVNLTKVVSLPTSITQRISEEIEMKRFILAVPPGWSISSIKDGSGFENINVFNKIEGLVSCHDNSLQNYTIYYTELTSQPAGFQFTYNV